jgi:sigma-B regulation protein RsbU (phosphoserine phosphatase)
MAARCLPAGVGGLVSGDFYDVHRVLGGDWAFVLGDVSGKGVEAAVVTSMARYTVRTLSAEGRTPRQVLEQLNRALLGEGGPERFCTVVYGRIDGADLLKAAGLLGGSGPFGADLGCTDLGCTDLGCTDRGCTDLGCTDLEGRGDDPSAAVHITLVLGGHPRPLVRRRDGSVEPVGTPGTVLGLLPGIDVEEVTVALEPGDVLLAYTDGVTEARRHSEQFGDERLIEVLGGAAGGLRGRTGITAAGLTAEAIAERVIGAVTEWSPDRDDVAVLVLAIA